MFENLQFSVAHTTIAVTRWFISGWLRIVGEPEVDSEMVEATVSKWQPPFDETVRHSLLGAYPKVVFSDMPEMPAMTNVNGIIRQLEQELTQRCGTFERPGCHIGL